jgi:N-acyl-D-amino-acid deacylase
VVGLAGVAARQGGIYASHIRSESDQVLESVAEVVDVGRKTGVQVEVAHLKLSGFRNWDRVEPLLGSLEEARAEGVKVGCDQYPYRASSTWLATMLPLSAQAGGAQAVARRLADAKIREELRADWEANRVAWDNRSGVRTWDDVLISECLPKPEVVGQTIADLAEAEGQDPLEVLFDLIVVSEGQASAVWFDQSEDNVRTIMQQSMVAVGSDGSALSPRGLLGQRKVHPRSYGTFPRVLGRYVREAGVLSLEEAVRKMTSLTADRFGLEGRGRIGERTWADLVVFDAASVLDRATFTEPAQYPAGIPYVVVNGQVVIDKGEHTGVLAGRVL